MSEYQVRFEVSWRDGSSEFSKVMKGNVVPRVGDTFYIDDDGGFLDGQDVAFVHHLETNGQVVTAVTLRPFDINESKSEQDGWFVEKGWNLS